MLLILILIIFLLTLIVPYFTNPLPFGYDPGIYLFAFKKYSQVSFLKFTTLPDWIISGIEPGLAVISKILSYFINPEIYLIPLIVAFSILLFVAFYIINKTIFGKKVALWSTLIFATSAVQYKAYWYYYIKQIAGSAFLFFTFYFISKTSKWTFVFSTLVFYFHRPTAVLLFITFITLLLFDKKNRKFVVRQLILTLIFTSLYYVPTFKLTIVPLIAPYLLGFVPKTMGGSMGSVSGTFYGIKDSLILSFLYLPFAAFGFIKNYREKKYLIITIPFITTLLIVFLKLFFYRRFIISLNLFAIPFAAIGAVTFFNSIKSNLFRKSFEIGYILLLILYITLFIKSNAKPLITKDEFMEIKTLRELEPDAKILSVSEKYTSFLYGWSDRTVIAPGYGENDIYWNKDEWQEFWLSGNYDRQVELLKKLPKPLYLYYGDRGEIIDLDLTGSCFEKVNFRTYKFLCNN